MKQSSASRTGINCGFSLAELMVGMFLTFLIMGSLYAILSAAVRYYLTSTKTISVQQACLVATSALSSELLESNLGCINSPSADTVIFGSPRNNAGDVKFDPTDGHMLWQKHVCYWVEPSKKPAGLQRKEINLAGPSTDVPIIPSTMTKASFQSAASQQRLVAEYIYALEVVRTSYVEVTIGAEDEDKQFRVVVATKLKTRN